ncbi:M56 family metallopeptidase, partial [Daejeonella sp.]|uniref:M56 family metallopeptidase n=1 Tax=Daejeonella sp. TaxID=2805397 RepID=UPI0030C26FBF
MEQNIFFSALSTSLLTSIGQGFIVYAFVKILLWSAPAMSAENRFKFLYSAMLLILAGFITSLVRSYSTEAASAEILATNISDISPYPGHQTIEVTFYQSTNYAKWIAGLYFTGIFIQGSIILAGLYHLQVFRKKSKLWSDKIWEERLQVLCKKLNINKSVKLHLAERVFSPFTAGFIKPMIIFPIAMLNRLSPEQVEAILLHELGHIKRNDYILNILHKIIETILFFNPFMWLLSRAIRREREFACDDLVMEYTKDTNQYARALLHIAESNLKNYSFGIAASGEINSTSLHAL